MSQSSFYQALNSSPVILWAVDKNGIFTESIGSGLADLGFKSKEVIGQRIYDVYADHPEILKYINRALAGECFTAEVEIGKCWFSTTYCPVIENGVKGVSAVSINITDTKKKEDRYHQLFDNMSEEVHYWQIVRDEEGMILTWRLMDANPPALKTWGFELKDIINKTADEFFPGSTDHYYWIVDKVFRENKPYTYEDYNPIMDKHFRFTTIPVGEFFFTTGADITRIKKNEEKYAELIGRYQQASRATRNPIWDWDLETNAALWTDALVTEFGYDRKELIGTGEFWFRHIHPADKDRVTKGIHAVLDSNDDHWNDEYRFQKGDGSYIWVYDRGFVSRDESGKAVRMTGAMENITERRLAEAELARQSDEFRHLADSMPQLVWMADANGVVEYYNSKVQEYEGATQDQNGHWVWSTLLHEDDLEKTAVAWIDSVRERKLYSIEHRVKMKNGTYRWHLSRGVPTYDQTGEVLKWFGTATDIEDIKRTEKKLIDALRSRDEFLSIASHELKTPLTSLILEEQSHAKLITMQRPEATDPARLSGRNMKYLRLFKRLNRLVDDMLDISRIQSGRLQIKKEPVSLFTLAKEIIQRLKGETPAVVDVDISLVGKDVTVEADALRIEQVLTNLLTNAIKYGEGKPVTVAVVPEGNSARVEVKDNGPGIPLDIQDKIFNRFERGVSANNISGLGLGLYISRQIVESHGGRLWVESKPDEGSKFSFSIP